MSKAQVIINGEPGAKNVAISVPPYRKRTGAAIGFPVRLQDDGTSLLWIPASILCLITRDRPDGVVYSAVVPQWFYTDRRELFDDLIFPDYYERPTGRSHDARARRGGEYRRSRKR